MINKYHKIINKLSTNEPIEILKISIFPAHFKIDYKGFEKILINQLIN